MPPPLQPQYVTDTPTSFVIDGAGRLVDPHSLQYVIYDTSTDAKRAAPVQVFPVSGKAEAERISLGYFRAPYEPNSSEAKGRRLVRWFCTYQENGTPRSWATPWEVLEQGRVEQPNPLYALVSDLRAEGITPQRLPDVRAQDLLNRVTTIIADVTGRIFAPMPKIIQINGRGRKAIQLGEEIIAVEYVHLVPQGTGEITTGVDGLIVDGVVDGVGDPVDLDSLLIYSRHLSQRLIRPDDRNNPRIELQRGCFPRGRQNVMVSGVFGYTEYDGSPMGRTPDAIRRATIMLLSNEVSPLAGRESANQALRVTMEKTRDQTVMYAQPRAAGVGLSTGDLDVDMILSNYLRPPSMGAA